VKIRDGNDEIRPYFHDEREVRKFFRRKSRSQFVRYRDGPGVVALTTAPVRNNGARRRGKLVELHESITIQKLMAELARKGFESDHYAGK